MPRRPAPSDSEFSGDSEPENDEEPRNSRRRAVPELHARERPVPQSDEYPRRAVEASNRRTPRQQSSEIDEDDEELQRVFEASLAEQKASQHRIRQREKRIAAREAADEAAAIAESARLAAYPTTAERQEADADAELERVLRESAAETTKKEARRKAALDSLHARFGENSAQQPQPSSSRDTAPSARRQRERVNSTPQSPAAPSTGQRERANSAPREPAASSTERLMSAGNNLLRRGVQLIRTSSGRANPAVRHSRHAAPARLAETSEEPEPPSSPAALSQLNTPREAESPTRGRPDPPRAAPTPRARPDPPRAAPTPRARPDPPRAAPTPRARPEPPRAAPTPRGRPDPPRAAPTPRARPDLPRAAPNSPRAPANPTREHAERQPGNSRRQPDTPAQRPNPRGQRNSERERAPYVERLPRRRALVVPRRDRGQGRNRGELDPSIRQALNNSERWGRMQQGLGAHNLREEEQMRMAIQNSLGDAPTPPDPIEGLIDPPPPYRKIGRDKKLDPLRYTTTNEKDNEPGHKRHITPEILAKMKKFRLQQEKFDAKAQAAGKNLPPANNAMAKKQKRAPVLDNPPVAGSSSSAANNVDSLENLLGTRLPPPRLARREPPNRAAASSDNDAFVSRVPGLASNARERIPQSRPWANAFSRLPTDRDSPRGHHGRH